MQDILQHINSIDGVIGSALFSQKGDVLAHCFPALIDVASLKKTAELTLECTHGLQISQNLELLDMRYSDGRVVAKRFPGAMLFLLCAKNINLQVLTITLNLAVKKLEEKIFYDSSAADKVAAKSDTGNDTDGILRLRISHLVNKQVDASFDSLGMIAVSQPTAQLINDFYKGSFKKLTLTNAGSGTSGSFPVMIMKDMHQHYDGTIVVGPSIEKKLRVNEGNLVEVRI